MRLLVKSLGLVVISLFLISAGYTEELDEYADKYELITTPQPVNDEHKIEVVELFWYNCPHCYHFERYLEPWIKKQPADVEVIFMPAIFNDSWAILAKAYYAAEILGVLDKIHLKFFEAIHAKNRQVKTESDIKAFFVEQGVNAEEFTKIYNSFGVDTKTRRAQVLTRKYGITGVPALIVNGKYRISGSNVTNSEEMLGVVNYLVQKERAAKQHDNLGTPSTTH